MTDFTDVFLDAFNHAMIYEVGGFWNAEDPDVIDGRIDTKEQRRKVGYVNIPSDRGGETKYGVAQKANVDLNIRAMNLDKAMSVYFDRYWLAGNCDKLPSALAIIHFDGCVNHGVGKAAKFLQKAAGVNADGAIGPATLRAVEAADEVQLIQEISQLRTDFYNAIVQRDASQGMFLKGWMKRINEVTDFTLAQL